MTQAVADGYTEKIFWEINIPKGVRGASIESFNIKRKAEAEFLIQRNSNLLINNARFNFDKEIWELQAILKQNIDNITPNVKMRIGG